MDVTFSPALRVYAEMWEIAGRRREADAQFAQALAHIRSGTPDAMAKAFDLFKRSGAHNFTEAQFAAGWCCEHGCGTKRNYPQAIRWYKRAENNVTSDVMSAFDPVGEAENARLRLYFECESYAAAVDALLDAQEREDSFMADYKAVVGGDAIGMLHLGHRYYYGQDVACRPGRGYPLVSPGRRGWQRCRHVAAGTDLRGGQALQGGGKMVSPLRGGSHPLAQPAAELVKKVPRNW